MGSCSVGELSWWGAVLVGTCPGGELSREWGFVLVGGGGGGGGGGLGLVVSYLVESCPGGELSRMGNRPGGELSCWGILVGLICVGVVQWGDILEHSKLLVDLLY